MKVRCGRTLALGAGALAIFTLTSCNWFRSRQLTETTKTVVVLVDRSASTGRDRALYQRAAKAVIEGLKPGDRLIASPITEASANDFRDYLDASLPAPLAPLRLWDVPQKYAAEKQAWEEQYKTKMNQIRQATDKLLEAPSGSPKTRIFESLRITAQILASEHRPVKVVVVLSDMLEDSNEADFEAMQLSDAAIAKELARQQQQQIVPDLRGVRVFVAGASGEPLERAAALERFWRRYFQEAGALIDPGGYSRAVPNFAF